MELHQIEYVLAVAKYQNFTRAAEEINVSQSSLSQQISKLESELGVNLFVRTTRSVQITPAGAEFINHAQRIMSEITAARRSIQEYLTTEKGYLTLGIIPVIGYYQIPKVLAEFQKNFPGIKMSLLESQCDDLLSMLRETKIDAAIVHHVISDPHYHYTTLLEDQMVVVVHKNHSLANRKAVGINDLRGEKFIITPPISGHHQDFVSACHAAGIEPEVILTCSQVRTILGLVREEIGVTVLSSCVAEMDITPDLCQIQLVPPIIRKINLVLLKNAYKSPALKMFYKYITNRFNVQASFSKGTMVRLGA